MTPAREKAFLNFLLLTALAFLTAALLTNLIPLVQLGWMHPLKSKNRYGNIVRAGTLVFFLLLIFARFWKPRIFPELHLVRFWNALTEKTARRGVLLLTLCYAASAMIIGWFRHEGLQTRAFDLGIFDQALWNTVHGNLLLSSLKDNTCLLGDHFSPFLLLLTPFYALWQDPRTLLFLQAAALALCIPALYSLTVKHLKDPRLALCFAFAFFLFYPERSALHEDFHPEVMAQPVLILAFLFMKERRWPAFAAALAVALSAKENFSGILFFFGLTLVFFEKQKVLGSALVLFSVVYLFLMTHWVIPEISGHAYLYSGFYKSAAQNPAGAFLRFLSPDSLSYTAKLFSPLLFLSFFHFPTLLLTAPVLIQNLLSDNPVTRSFGYHYTAGLSPFVFISAIYGCGVVLEKFPALKRRTSWLAAALVLSSLLRSGPSEYYYFYNSLKNGSVVTPAKRAALSQIPPDASVLTHNNWIPQVSRRKTVYQLEYNPTPTKLEQAGKLKADYLIFDKTFWEPKTKSFEDTLADFDGAGYEKLFSEGDFVLYRKPALKN